MTNTISYKNIIKLIHPDLNPNISDAAEKISKVKLFYKNEIMLYKFGVEWGVIPKCIPKTIIKTVKPVNIVASNKKNYKPIPTDSIIRRGDRVYIKTLNIYTICVKVTSKRVYFKKLDGNITFCNKSNAVKMG